MLSCFCRPQKFAPQRTVRRGSFFPMIYLFLPHFITSPFLYLHLSLSLSHSLTPSSSPPPMHMGFQAQGYFISPHPGFYDGPGPFSPPGPPMGGPLLYPPFFSPPYGYMPHPFPPQQMPPLVPYNVPNC